jgi:hypothetical protein
MMSIDTTSDTEAEAFFREYTSPAAIAKYSRATAGCGISYLLDHDYRGLPKGVIFCLLRSYKEASVYSNSAAEPG